MDSNGIYTLNSDTNNGKTIKPELIKAMLITSLVYGIVFTALMYDNFNALMTPVVAAGAIVIGVIFLKKLGYAIKPGFTFLAVAVELLAINICMTRDGVLVFFDYAAMIIFTLLALVHQLNDDSKWTFGNYFVISNVLFGNIFKHLPDFVSDPIRFGKTKERKNRKGAAVLIGICIAIPILTIVLILLSSADIVFNSLVSGILETIFSPTIFGIIFLFVNVVFFFYALIKATGCYGDRKIDVKEGSIEPAIAITIGCMLGFVYVIFSVIQIAYLFIGNFELPSGYTYSEYVHQGFEELIIVCFLNMVLVLLGRSLFKRSRILNVILIVISLCTYNMLASCAVRLGMYISAYHMTVLRFLVIWALVIIGVLMAGVMVYICRDNFPIFRFGTVCVVIWFTALSLCHPDYQVMKYNLNRAVTDNSVDYEYMVRLSSDAAPAIIDVIENNPGGIYYYDGRDSYSFMSCASRFFRSDSDFYNGKEKENIRNFNFSLHYCIEKYEEYFKDT